jgi:Mn2+/Fe2+ NRAMP family transporter
MIVIYGRYTLVTGETALQAFRKHLHPAVGLFFIIALTAGVSGSVMGVMGIVAEMSFEWSKTFIDGGIEPIYFAAFFIAVVYFIFWNGKTEFFERALAVIVAVMAACFILNFFILMPSASDMAKGLLPNIPEMAPGESKGPFLLIASMVGTTLFSGLFIIRTTLVKAAGWTLEDDKQQKRDALFATTLMFVISGAIMAAAAGSLHAEGIVMDKASQMIGLLEPLAGAFAASIFAIGIIAAGVSSQSPNTIMLPWLICDYTNSELEMTLPRYRIMVLLISLLGLVVPIFNARPLFVMIASQAFNSVLLPATVACIFILGNKESVMGKYTHSTITNIILIAIFLFSLVTSYMGIQGVLGLLS